jgi:hypothetical protein
MGRPLIGKNVLVIKQIEVAQKGTGLIDRAVNSLLNDDTVEIDAIVLEDVQDPKWMERLLAGKNGKYHWMLSPVEGQNNVYVTREQVANDFSGGKRRRSRRRSRKRRRSRRR